MSRSESDTDLAKYMPSIEAMREQADEAAAQERMRKALDNPELDAAIEELRGEAPTLPMPAPEPTRRAPMPASPWSDRSAEAGAIDKSMLPSANAPAAPPVTTPVDVDAPPSIEKPWSTTRKGLAAIAFAFLPAVLVFMLFVKPTQNGAPYVPASASVAVPPVASVAVGAEPAMSAAAPAPALSVEPNVGVDAGAGAARPGPAPLAPSTSVVKPSPRLPAPRVPSEPAPTPTVTPTAPPSAVAPEPPPPPKFVR